MPTIINNLKTRLTTKITAMLLAALCVALLAIGYTLWLSWQLEGAAAAINDSGSLRMRAWKIAALLNQTNQDRSFTPQQLAEVKTIQQQFEITLAELRKGDPQRPLFLPRQRQIQQQLTILERTWQQQFVPFLSNVQQYKHLNPQQAQIWLTQTNLFVEQIYQTVNLIEEEYARQTFWLRSSQMMLIFMAFIGTLVMIILLNLMIIRPVNSLHQGIQQMYNGDFSVRLTIEGEDEFAQLSAGFNAMANQLQQLYNNLEQRVNEKTESIAKKNRYLSVLYDFSQKLNQHHSLEELSRHFLQRLMLEFNATGGSVRLIDKTANKIYSVVDEGIPPSLSQQMQCQQLGSCFCTQAAEQAKTAINNLNQHFSPYFS
ncbi:MAG TPA: type IV pili methyl-accepting chemotaxis transducer N-terminal domain-containing protein, partial [Agitococcus sp.]|nr:type IV pili methyl-accepting chemotaxis transducer N-terminal domain-containing protein [Agitococcus sp.]